MSEDLPLLDEYGFLVNSDDWDRDVAASLARHYAAGPLDDRHFAVMEALRRHYRHYRAIPSATHVCLEVDLEESCIDALFDGPLVAWKLAGLPNPGEEARVYLDNQTPP